MRVVIFAGGTFQPGTASQKALARADMIIAADSGAATALRLGHVPAWVVGDFDSLDAQLVEQLRARGSSYHLRSSRERRDGYRTRHATRH